MIAISIYTPYFLLKLGTIFLGFHKSCIDWKTSQFRFKYFKYFKQHSFSFFAMHFTNTQHCPLNPLFPPCIQLDSNGADDVVAKITTISNIFIVASSILQCNAFLIYIYAFVIYAICWAVSLHLYFFTHKTPCNDMATSMESGCLCYTYTCIRMGFPEFYQQHVKNSRKTPNIWKGSCRIPFSTFTV